MIMTGRGGGNFYVLVLVIAGQAIHQAATTGQFILILTALAGLLLFSKHKLVDWKLGCWHRRYGDQEYVVNLWLAIPITAAVGLVAGAVGISGGSFKVPLWF